MFFCCCLENKEIKFNNKRENKNVSRSVLIQVLYMSTQKQQYVYFDKMQNFILSFILLKSIICYYI